jgi:hypothetical protein
MSGTARPIPAELAAIAKRVLAAAGERRLGIIAAEFDALLELERLLRVDRR